MTGKALICKLQNIKPIEGADRIVQANMFGETVIISKDYKEGTTGLLFDCETQLSHEYCYHNNLYRKPELNEQKTKVGYIEENRRVRPIKLKGVRCSALWMPIESLRFRTTDSGKFPITGMEIDSFDGIELCQKYITQKTKQLQGKNQKGKARQNLCPTFKEHIDTGQVLRNLHLIQEGNLVTITEKLHGCSGRCGYLPVLKYREGIEKLLVKLMSFLFAKRWRNDYTQYDFVVGSRRVVKRIGEEEREGSSYYDTDIWSIASDKYFKGKLNKGETIYFEIVGYLPDGQPIMGSHLNKKLEKFMDKEEYHEFIVRYGETTEFNYECSPYLYNKEQVDYNIKNPSKPAWYRPTNQYDVYVYRITMTNEDGESFDLSWDQVKMRCERMGVKHVPEISRFIHENDYRYTLEDRINDYTNQDSETFKSHLKEGVIVRVDNGANTPIFLKNKGWNFKCLEGIIKDTDVVDLEESQG